VQAFRNYVHFFEQKFIKQAKDYEFPFLIKENKVKRKNK
jgi:hypothetical protein